MSTIMGSLVSFFRSYFKREKCEKEALAAIHF